MQKIKWLHLSDLHFGSEEKYSEIVTVRKTLLEFIRKELTGESVGYLLISGDLVYAPVFYRAERNVKKSIINKLCEFISEIVSILKIKPENIFIVPGNHDVERSDDKGRAISELQSKALGGFYSIPGNSLYKLLENQTNFNEICETITNSIGKIEYCVQSHKIIIRNEADFLLLNTSLTTNSDQDKPGDLLLDEKTFNESLAKHTDRHKPLIVLAHHAPHWYSRDEKALICRVLKEKSELPLYLCGHEHSSAEAEYDGVRVFCCGTNMAFEKGENEVAGEKQIYFRNNDMVILVGEVDSDIGEAIIGAYKWTPKNQVWIPDRDVINEEPYYMVRVANDTYATILGANSETAARNAFFGYARKVIKSAKSENVSDAITHIYTELGRVINILVERLEFQAFNKLTQTLLPPIKTAESIDQVLDILNEVRNRDITATTDINRHIDKIFEPFINNEKDCGILLYSKSTQVTDLLKAVERDIKKRCTLYICAGSVRRNRETDKDFKDAVDISKELICDDWDYGGYKIQIIPDIYFYSLMETGKINLVLFGAHSVFYNTGGYTAFDNTIGTGLIVQKARELNIPYYVIASSAKLAKEDASIKEKICNKKDHFQKEKNIQLLEKSYPGLKILKDNPVISFHELELIPFTKEDNDRESVISNSGPSENFQFVSRETINLFGNILKDRRPLRQEQGTIIKEYVGPSSTLESAVEIEILRGLIASGVNVPQILESEEEKVKLKYYKGIRVFNLVCLLTKLKDEYGLSAEQKAEIGTIIRTLLSKCEQNQIKIQRWLFEYNQKNPSKHSVYPFEKITEMIDLFFGCFNLKKINKECLLTELEKIYAEFNKNAVVPFRDSTTKNMLVCCEALHASNFLSRDKKLDDSIRIEFLKECLEQGTLNSLIGESSIIDLDFSSCVNLTTPSDDVISFKLHEWTDKYFSFDDLGLWNEDICNTLSEKEIAATFFVRYLRFGGRKAIYRCLDKSTHSIRFKYDSEYFYFVNLKRMLIKYWDNAERELPETIKFLTRVEEVLRSDEEYFPEENIAKDVEKEISKRVTYSDVFPF